MLLLGGIVTWITVINIPETRMPFANPRETPSILSKAVKPEDEDIFLTKKKMDLIPIKKIRKIKTKDTTPCISGKVILFKKSERTT